MQVPDLRAGPPRRWNETIDGVPWLPRLIDKTRAALNGTLGAYLYGQSPVDRSLLRVLGLGYRSLAEIVAAAPDDAAVIAAIAERDPQALARARVWGAGLGRRHRWFLTLLDIDDGYSPHLRLLRPAITACANAVTWTMKRIWPSRVGRGNVATAANEEAP